MDDEKWTRVKVSEIERLRAGAEWLKSVLESIANDGCGCARTVKDEDGIGSRSLWCHDLYPDDRGRWCWCCIARAALKEHGDE